jgi:hypothetical protein
VGYKVALEGQTDTHAHVMIWQDAPRIGGGGGREYARQRDCVRNYLEHQGEGGRGAILKQSLRKWDASLWTGFIWHRTGSSGELLKTR